MSASPTEGTDMNQIEKALSDYLGEMCGMRLKPHALTGLAKAAIAAMQPAPQWQGIESAPRDGTIILLGLPIVGNLREVDRRVYEGRWHEEQKIFTSVNGFILLAAATHWMPLPTPPAGGSDAE